MKKILTILLALLLIVNLPIAARAAGSTSVGAVSVSYGRLNVRASRSTSSAIVATLSKGSYVTLISRDGSWWQVRYGKDGYGYCHADYITSVAATPATVKLSWGTLNVRNGAGTGYARIDALHNGESVAVLSASNGWSRILYHGTKLGYVSSTYLATQTQNGAVALAVPSYKQTDSRWSGVKIGSSGKTIGQIGCTTTGIAMMESYRSGTTITPADMSRRLTYTASGNVYWPADYKVTTSYSLSHILSLLQAGKPVLIGARNGYGSQHWVVITGYNGAGLSASNFSINDPGSHTRTNLQQFLNVYPNFYKYFHY